MHHRADMPGARIQRRAHHPAYFSVLFNTFAYKSGIAAQDEIAFHLFPDKMKLIVRSPNIGTRTRENISLYFIIILAGAETFHPADFCLAVKNTFRVGLSV